MRPQTNFHNVCAEILAGQPLNCPDTAKKTSTAYSSQPLLEFNETRVQLVRVLPHQSMKLAMKLADSHSSLGVPQVIEALDAASISSGFPKGPEKALQPGDFVWMDGGPGHERVYQNRGDKETRLLEIIFPRVP